MLELSGVSRSSARSEDDLEQLRRDILGLGPDDDEEQASETEDHRNDASISLNENSSSLNSSFRIDPSGTPGQEEAFQPRVFSSPARNLGWDSEEDAGNKSLDSVESLFTEEVEQPVLQGEVQPKSGPSASSNSGPPIADLVAEALNQAGIPTAQRTQDIPSSSSPAAVSEDPSAIPADLEGLVSLQPSSSALAEEIS